jgi:hypothetical protein
MAFLVDEQTVFVDAHIAGQLTGEGLARDLLPAYQASLEIGTGVPTGTGHVMGTYVEIPRSDPAMQQFCADDLSHLAGMWPEKLAAAICGGAPDRLPPLARISFTTEPPCKAEDFVACGNPGEYIALDVSLTQYFKTTRGGWGATWTRTLLGDPDGGEADLSAVLLHEAGHFFGLGHLQIENQPADFPAAMLGDYREDFCVSSTDTAMLNSSVDLNWGYRAKTLEHLRRPQSMRKQ